ncbi:putative adipose-regulatory protein-domain-containing protein [Powellomyces hirtus]|nr:putative adipose-regulatory protein-domain-containing protein [Powellomyces hirtus]
MIRDKFARYITKPIHSLTEPYVRLGYDGLTSTKTQRVALNTAIFGAVFAALLSIAVAVYALFYCVYIPQVTWVIPVYMQYGSPGTISQPQAYVDFTGGRARQQSAYLTPEQHYDLALELVVPDSDRNFELGNFMVRIDLYTKDNKTTASSSRPATLEYRTPLLRTMRTLWNGLPLLLGLSKEAQTVKLLLLEKYEEMQASPIHHALIHLSDARLQLYETRLHIDANFQGLRYFMYHWQATTGAVFVAGFMFWGTLMCFMGWRLLLSLFKSRDATDGGSASSSTGEQGSRTPSVEGNADQGAKANGEFIVGDRHDSEDNDAFNPPPSVIHTAHLMASPRSMSSAPSYHSGHPPFGSPPQYAVHTSPPPSFDGRISPYQGRGSAYSYAFPYSSAGYAGTGLLPFTGYTSVSALRAAVVGSADAGTSPSTFSGLSCPVQSLTPLPPPLTAPLEETIGHKSSTHGSHLPRDDTNVTLDMPFLAEDLSLSDSSTAGLRLRRRPTLGGDAVGGQESDVLLEDGGPSGNSSDAFAQDVPVAAEDLKNAAHLEDSEATRSNMQQRPDVELSADDQVIVVNASLTSMGKVDNDTGTNENS